MKVIYYEVLETASTNDLAKQLFHCFDPRALTVIYTFQQTNGRGQFGKKWFSSGKDVAVSFCFFLKQGFSDLDFSCLIRPGAEAILDLLKDLGYHQAVIKWPNDILCSKDKLSGILCEIITIPEGSVIILGVGINVNSSKEDLRDVGQDATSLAILLNRKISPYFVVEKLTEHFLPKLSSLFNGKNALQE